MATQIHAANDKLHNQVITCKRPNRATCPCLWMKLYACLPVLDIVDGV